LRQKEFCGFFLAFASIVLLTLMARLQSMEAAMLIYAAGMATLLFAVYKGCFDMPFVMGIGAVFFTSILLILLFYLPMEEMINERLLCFQDPMRDPNGRGYVHRILRETMAGTVFWGEGTIPAEISHISRIPEIRVNFSFTYLAYRFGWWVMPAAALLLLVSTGFGFYRAAKEKNLMVSLLIFAIMMTFLLEGAGFLLANLGWGSTSPLAFPFLSFSKSRAAINTVLMGILCSLLRTYEAFDAHRGKKENMFLTED